MVQVNMPWVLMLESNALIILTSQEQKYVKLYTPNFSALALLDAKN